MAFDELLTWASGRNVWQQDALRRLALNGELLDEDLEELRQQIERLAGLPTKNAPEPVPLNREHMSAGVGNDPRTVLASLGPVRNIDKLAPDQPALRFAINGVTLVYGANASGKSGYCRIAKQLCRSLSQGSIRSDVYREDQTDPPEVSVAFRVGGDDQPKQERIWTTDHDPPGELARISVFDTASARVYVDNTRRIEFLPYELDLMNKLGLACKALETVFRERENTLKSIVGTRLPEGFSPGSTVQSMIARLNTDTPLDELPTEEEIRALADFSAGLRAELDTVTQRLNQDPHVLAQLRGQARRALDTIRQDITSVTDVLGDPAIATFRQKHQESIATSEAAQAAARDLFTDQPLPDLGSDTWRQMLTYAREFATEVFTDKDPPQIATGGLCVLCQQELDGSAVARLAAFDDYIAGRAAADSADAKRTFQEHYDKLMAYRVRSRRETETLLAGYAALDEVRTGNVSMIATYLEQAGERLATIQAVLQAGDFEELDRLGPLSSAPTQSIAEDLERLSEEIDELEGAERDERVLTIQRTRQAELSDQQRISEHIEIFVERRRRLEELCRVTMCLGECRLNAITRRITERRRVILTPSLRSALRTELHRLGLDHIPLDLSDHGQGGESIVEVSLNARQRVSSNSEVLSEGEQRALALACFLAELGEIGNDHGIIIDDPVSSLDHTRMQAVAERLAEEAANGRQVIVFTHSLLFHSMLWSEARRARVGRHREWMRSAGNDLFGVIEHDKKPGQLKSVSERIHEIEHNFRTLKDAGYESTDPNLRSSIVGLYASMRETWERIIEEILFNNTVQRFRPEVLTQRLEQACFDPADDYPAIFEGMKRCSHYSGHDPAPDLPPDLPDTSQIESDIGALSNFSRAAKKRQKELEKTKYEKGVEPVLL